MLHFRATGLFTVCAALALDPAAAAQSAFRPLPSLPSLDRFVATKSAASNPGPTELAELQPDEPIAASQLFVDAELFATVFEDSNLETGGSLAMQHGGWSAKVGRERDGKTLGAVELSTEAFFYNFSGSTTLVPGSADPFNDLYRARIAGTLRTPIDAQIAYFGGLELALNGEDEASARESFTIGAVGGVEIAPRGDGSVSLGVAVLSRLEDDPWIWPWIGFEWSASDWLAFEARGTEVEALAKLSEHWRAIARAEYTIRQFRLNDSGPLAGGVFRDNDIHMGLGLERRGHDGFGFELLGGVSVWRELSTLDRSGDEIAESELDPAVFVALKLGLSF